MKKLISLLVLSLSIHAHATEYNPELPVWKQYDSLYCKYEKYIRCRTDSAACSVITEKLYLDHAFVLDFKKNKMRYLGILDIESPIISYTFRKKDNLATTINHIHLDESIIQIVYLNNKNYKLMNPRFELTRIQFSYLDVESEAEVGAFFSNRSICYVNKIN